MPNVDTSLFSDVADSLGISSPVIVEKDYYAVQLLRLLNTLSLSAYQLIFAGGTCLAKAHRNTFRMSEDIDLKLVPSAETLKLSKSQQRKERANAYREILKLLNSSETFQVFESKRRNENTYQQFLISYPQTCDGIDSLRPHLQLDITESYLLEPAAPKIIRSLYAELLDYPAEINNCLCVSIETMACEKFVAVLRKTAAVQRDSQRKDDETLIRHIYDLHLIRDSIPDLPALQHLVQQVIDTDVSQFGNQHAEFRQAPHKELRFGASCLVEQQIHKQRYEKFIGPLVYHKSPADWEAALTTLLVLTDTWLAP